MAEPHAHSQPIETYGLAHTIETYGHTIAGRRRRRHAWPILLFVLLAALYPLLLTLYYSLIYPYIAYCNIIWASNYKSRLYRLKILQKRSVRIIAGLPYNSHTDPI